MRTIIPLRHDWKFTKSRNVAEGENLNVDDGNWRDVRVPHDWAIEGPFDSHHDVQVRINSLFLGRTGGLPHVGMAWCRRRFRLPGEDVRRRVWAEFDGVMSHAVVFVNGLEVGRWPYGYSSFRFDITDAVDFEGENVLSVSVSNPPFASRWYPGAGIYRNVRLVVVDRVHVAPWGTTVTTPAVAEESATVQVRNELVNETGGPSEVTVETAILDPDGVEVSRTRHEHKVERKLVSVQRHTLHAPRRWDVDAPALYRAVTTVSREGEVCDRTETRFGIRTTDFAPDGFRLNGRTLRLNGVCLHHDLGALGAAVNARATERQLEILKQMGCNAIRTSHNPPSPEQLDACDRLGMLVIDEVFDAWEQPKHGQVTNGYNALFAEWAERDLSALLRRDRNHPSVIMWSIGNEIPEQSSARGAELARRLTGICHREDPTRPTTAGYNQAREAERNGLCDAVDIVGLNYEHGNYHHYRQEHPHWIMYGSETDSCVSSRGVYADRLFDACQQQKASPYAPNALTDPDVRSGTPQNAAKREDLHMPSWDTAGNTAPDYEFAAQEDFPWLLGQFVWTGFDYLGEPSPYMADWPSRSSYFGILDTCGFRKDRFYLYQSRWSNEPVLHLLPHWNWPGHEGKPIPVVCYTNYAAAELFVNGVSQGVRRKDPADVFKRFRLIWQDVPYEPGELCVVAHDDSGKPVDEDVVETTGSPAAIRVVPDRTEIAADGDDLAFVTLEIVDADGRLCPTASNRVSVQVEGPGDLLAMDNGDPTDLDAFQRADRRAFNGLALAIVRSREGHPGPLAISAAAEGLEGARAPLTARDAGA